MKHKQKQLAVACALFVWASFAHADQAAIIDGSANYNMYKDAIGSWNVKQPEIQKEIQNSILFEEIKTVPGLSDVELKELKDLSSVFVGKHVNPAQVVFLLTEGMQKKGYSVVLNMDGNSWQAIHPILGRIVIKNETGIKESVIRDIVSLDVEVGALLNRSQLEKNASTLNGLHGVVSSYDMVPGEQPGQTDLVVSVKESTKVSGDITVDSNGNSYSGEVQTSGMLSIDNLLDKGERIRLAGIKMKNSEMIMIGTDVLLSENGLWLGLNAGQSKYEYDAIGCGCRIKYSGGSDFVGFSLNYALEKNEYASTVVSVLVDKKVHKSQINNVESSLWENKTVIGRLVGKQALPAMSNVEYVVTLTHGNAQQNNAIALLSEPFLKQTGDFNILSAKTTYTKQIPKISENTSIAFTGIAQVSDKNLPSSEKMSLGGFGLMRAFSPIVISGDEVVYAEAKVEKWFSESVRVGVFAETAYVKSFKDKLTAASLQSNYSDVNKISDFGVSFLWTNGGNFDVMTTVAKKIGGDPKYLNGSLIGSTNHQDGKVAGYVKATYRF